MPNHPTGWQNGWSKQTAILSDLSYQTNTPGIWQDRVSNRDRRCQVTDNEVKNLRRRDKYLMSVDLVERFMRLLPKERARAVDSRTKWAAVDMVKAGDLEAAACLLAGKL